MFGRCRHGHEWEVYRDTGYTSHERCARCGQTRHMTYRDGEPAPKPFSFTPTNNPGKAIITDSPYSVYATMGDIFLDPLSHTRVWSVS